MLKRPPGAFEQSWRYVAPFAVLLVLLGGLESLPLAPPVAYAVRTVVVAAVLLVCSRQLVRLRPSHALSSVLLGAAVFVIWIGPDLLWPGYRSHWIFRNHLTGGGLPGPVPVPTDSAALLWFRILGSALLVPVVEELFWRAWLMRRLIHRDFARLPLGTYAPQAFWITALLFASEHGSYWDVGLAAGILYGWWMVRTRSLADCILAHAVTNVSLAAYVVRTGAWQFWL